MKLTNSRSKLIVIGWILSKRIDCWTWNMTESILGSRTDASDVAIETVITLRVPEWLMGVFHMKGVLER